MKKLKIMVSIIFALILLVAAAGFYKFNFTDSDIYSSGDNISPESYKVFEGSWIRKKPNNEWKDGFILKADSTASSINMATLLYEKWRIENNKLILTAKSIGNHTTSVSDEVYIIKSFNNENLFLEKDGVDYVYEKLSRQGSWVWNWLKL